VASTGQRIVMWQIRWQYPDAGDEQQLDHYQDNRVEWLLDDPSRAHLNEYLQAGVIAFLSDGARMGDLRL